MRRLGHALVLAAGLALVAGAGIWLCRLPLLAWSATRLIERQGLGPVHLVIDAVDLHEFRARDVTLRGGAIRADAVTVSYRPLELAARHLRRVEIDGLAVALAVGPEGVEAGGRPLGAASGGGGGLRVDTLALSGARLSIETPAGPVEATLSATLALAGEDVRATALSATITAPLAGTRRTARIEAQSLAYVPQAEGGARLRVVQAGATPDDLRWTAQGVDGEFAWEGDRGTAQLAITRLADRQQRMLVAPLSLAANATFAGPRLDFTLHAEAGPAAAARLEARGWHDRSSGSGMASISVEPMVFQRGAVQPADIFPVLGGMIEDVEGSLAAAGSLRWSGGGLSPDVVVTTKNLAFTTSAATLRDLKGAVRLVGLWPPATPPGQVLTATLEAAGLPPAQLRLQGQLVAKPALKVERLAIALAGGEITSLPFAVDPAAPQLKTVLQVDHIDLAEITRLLSVGGLSGTGQLDGRIPLNLDRGKVAINAGRLASRGPGVLRYKPDKLPKELTAAGEPVKLMLEALSDFHYDSLALELDKPFEGTGTVLLRLTGRNPAVLSGRPFNFNIRIESDFDRLAGYALLSLRSAQDLLRRAARR